MRVNSCSNLPAEAVAAQVEVAIEKQGLDQIKDQGEAVVKMIDNSAPGVNRPLSEGPVGRMINIKI